MTLDSAMSNELRGMVREVLRDVMAQRPSSSPPAIEAVRLSNDADLHAFVLRLMDPAMQDRIRNGGLRFTLGPSTAPAPDSAGGALTGVITEKAIDRAPKGGTLVLGAGAVLTPLARDRARSFGLKIERRP